MIRRRIFILAAAFHFAVIILHNIVFSATGYKSVYGKPGRPHSSGLITIQHVLQTSFIWQYARFSGTETGFGFFAPQVGSQFISVFALYDAKGTLIGQRQHPDLQSKESMLRYSVFLDMFQSLLGPNENLGEFDKRYARAVVFSIGKRLGKRYGADRVDCRIFLYKTPRLYSDKPLNNQILLVYEKNLDIKHHHEKVSIP